MSDKIYTIEDIIDYNICPQKYKLKNILGFTCATHTIKQQIADQYEEHGFNSIKRSLYYFFKKLQRDEIITIDQFKKQFGNIYYKYFNGLDIIGMETRSPNELEPIFTKSLSSALDTFKMLSKTKWHPIIVDKTIQTRVGEYNISGKIDVVAENKNNTNSIEIISFNKYKNNKPLDDMYVKNNFNLNFGRHVLKTELDARENRISLVYPHKGIRQAVSKPDDEYLQRFLDITEHTCRDIEDGYFPAFVNKMKCESCLYKAVCDSYRERT